jgi:hypothetical protein
VANHLNLILRSLRHPPLVLGWNDQRSLSTRTNPPLPLPITSLLRPPSSFLPHFPLLGKWGRPGGGISAVNAQFNPALAGRRCTAPEEAIFLLFSSNPLFFQLAISKATIPFYNRSLRGSEAIRPVLSLEGACIFLPTCLHMIQWNLSAFTTTIGKISTEIKTFLLFKCLKVVNKP